MRKNVFITGATSGIGKACAELFAAHNYRIIITGRRKERLENLSMMLSQYTDVFPLCFDIRNYHETKNAFNSLPDDWKKTDILINNAGLAAGLDPVDTASVDDWEQMIDTNVKGLLYISHLISPGMVASGSGHIINVGSIAGREVYPNGSVYCATKAAVDALTKGMRLDLAKYGIKVSAVCPGMTETEFSMVRFKGDMAKAKSVYENIKPLTAEDIANIIFYVASAPDHVNIADVLVVPTKQAGASFIYRNQ